jgi:phosphoribosylanthranilate isomerase
MTMLAKIKICGVTTPAEISLLDAHDVSYAGLWYGIPRGRYNLDLQNLAQLSSIPTRTLKSILVTIENDIGALLEAIHHSHVSGIQFHGFQLPGTIKRIKQEFGSSLKIFKVLHIKNNSCSEESLIKRYIDAGTDVFILDTYLDKENLGSTGIKLNTDFLDSFFSRWPLNTRAMIAGGLDEYALADTIQSYQPYGIDIDTAARAKGTINTERVRHLMAARDSLALS